MYYLVKKNSLIFILCLALILFNIGCTKPIEACFIYYPSINISTGASVTFDASCTKNANYSYEWNFGDNTKDTLILSTPIIVHKYKNSGIYNVSLKVETKDGVLWRQSKKTSYSKTITIQ
jgi:PKD repeat protein